MAKRGRGRRGGNYNFTSRRRYALKRAQAISAKKRRNKRIKTAAAVVGTLAGVGTAAYLGHKHRATIAKHASNWRISVVPTRKEQVRVSSAISVAPPSRTTVITPGARASAQATRNALEKAQLPPHMGGPDRRIYDDDDNVNTDAMNERSVKRTLRHARAKTRGKKAKSFTGTPGGTQTPKKAIKKPGAEKHGGLTEEEWNAALGGESQTPYRPATKSGPPGGATRGKTVPKVTAAKSGIQVKIPQSGDVVEYKHKHRVNQFESYETYEYGRVVGSDKGNVLINMYEGKNFGNKTLKVPNSRITQHRKARKRVSPNPQHISDTQWQIMGLTMKRSLATPGKKVANTNLRDWTEAEKKSGKAHAYYLKTGRIMHPSNYRD